MSVISSVGEAVKELLAKNAGQITAAVTANRPLLLEEAGKLFDKYIAAYDIPQIPNTIETAVVDPALRKALLAVVADVLDRVVNELQELAEPAK